MFLRLLTAVTAAAVLVPAAASASVVTHEGPAGAEILVLRGAPGERNDLSVQSGTVPGSVRLYDAKNPVTELPASCGDDRASNFVTCAAPGGVRLELADGDDWATVSSDVTAPVTVLGGPGADRLEGSSVADVLSGEAGDDTLRGYGGDDVLDGGEGHDELDGHAGSDRLSAGAGDDLLMPDHYEAAASDVVDGGPGVDRIEEDYSTRLIGDVEPPLTFTAGGDADDGRPGERDDVRGVERFLLSTGTTFTGTEAAEYVKLHQVSEPGTLVGLGGNDELRGGDGADAIDGGVGDDLLDGGYGDDTITGGPGRDRISADLAGGDCGPAYCKDPHGNDVVLANDGEVDSVTCGVGTDRVVADADDVVAPDCEAVERTAAAVVTGPGPHGNGHTPTARLRLSAVKGQRLRTALRRGLRVRLTGATTRVTVRAKVAGRTVAKGSGRTSVVLRFTPAARRQLARKGRVRLAITSGAARSTVTLRR